MLISHTISLADLIRPSPATRFKNRTVVLKIQNVLLEVTLPSCYNHAKYKVSIQVTVTDT